MTEHTATSPTPVTALPPEALAAFAAEQRAAYDALLTRSLKLDLTRGKPAPAQLDLSEGLLSLPRGHVDSSGTDIRNYGACRASPRSARSSASCSGSRPRSSWPAATAA